MDLLVRIEERFDFYKAEAFMAKYWHFSIIYLCLLRGEYIFYQALDERPREVQP